MIAETSRRSLAQVKADEWYDRVRVLMVSDTTLDWCISEIGRELDEQNSTISARLNEMRAFGWIEKVGQRKSRVTGVESMVYRLKS